MKKLISIIVCCVLSLSAFAQDAYVVWSHKVEKVEKDLYKVIFSAKIKEGYHSYSIKDEISATEFLDCSVTGGKLEGEVIETLKAIPYPDGSLCYEGEMEYVQLIRLKAAEALYSGTIYTDACKKGEGCHSEYYDFEISLKSR